MAAQNKRADLGGPGGRQPGASLWERLERPAPTPRNTLTPATLAEAAVRIADAEGMQAVTMRRLATELRVAPMAAYRHVSGKDDLWALMVDRVAAELVVPDEVTGWREVLREMALRTRGTTLAHPWLTTVPAPLSLLTPHRIAAAERQIAALDGHGLDADTLMVAFRTVNAYVQGAVQAEVALRAYMDEQGWASGDDIRLGLAPTMKWLMGTDRYPVYGATLRALRRRDDPAWEFATGLDCVLDGLAARLGLP
ncbi:TetR/AcrR family transcriptional regulator [Streptomyces uncialis]|uniref:TetR/AcrR family transcriptional regulator n=1 Tax=Streptomyces uncialis TaxID=1048205 RepID=UPI00386A7C76|nr:TetR/AcrR family transcriptional regulator [Streptomyces uncialis]